MSNNDESNFYTIDMPSDVDPYPPQEEVKEVDAVAEALEENKQVIAGLQAQIQQYAQTQEQMSREQKIDKIDELIAHAKDASDFETHAGLMVEKNNLQMQAQPPAEPTMTIPEHNFFSANSWWDEDDPESRRLKSECIRIEKIYASANPNASQADGLNYVHAHIRTENPENEKLGNVSKTNEDKSMVPSNNMINTQKYTKQVKIDKSSLSGRLSASDMEFLRNKEAAGDSEASIEKWISNRLKERAERR